MGKIIKFVYVLVIFFSLFLVPKNVNGKPFLSFSNFLFTSYTIFIPL